MTFGLDVTSDHVPDSRAVCNWLCQFPDSQSTAKGRARLPESRARLALPSSSSKVSAGCVSWDPPPPPLPPTTHPEISRSHLKQESPRAGPPGHDTSKAHQEFRDDWLIFIPQLCTKQFYRAVPVFSEALFAPRSTGWAFLVDKVQARAGEDSCPFTKGCDTALPPQTHTHAHTIHTHTCTPPATHVPPGRTPHTSLMNPPHTHTHLSHGPRTPTPNTHTVYPRFTLPTPHTNPQSSHLHLPHTSRAPAPDVLPHCTRVHTHTPTHT